MKRWLILAMGLAMGLGAGAQAVTDSVWREEVKTVMLYCENAEQEMPVLALEGGQRMLLQFDMLGDQPRHLRYSIAHCDAQWRRDDLQPYEFMTGFEGGTVENYDFSFTTMTSFVHYWVMLPDEYARFVVSGNYVVTVSLDEEADSVLLTRRFCVSEQSVGVDAAVVRPYDGMAIDRRQEVDVCLSSQWPLTPQYLTVTVQQNGRTDNMRTLEFSGYDRGALCYRQRAANVFTGGNTFRFFDMSNLRSPMYNVQRIERYGGETFVLLRPEEDRSRKHYLGETTLQGGMKVNVWDRENKALEADYVWVNISLPMAQPMLGGSLYVVGALTDWQLDSASRMEYKPEYKAYVKRLLLKQGYYAYQLLYRPARGGEGETALVEGDHRESPNRYTIRVYMRTPADRSDRLIAVRSVTAP